MHCAQATALRIARDKQSSGIKSRMPEDAISKLVLAHRRRRAPPCEGLVDQADHAFQLAVTEGLN